MKFLSFITTNLLSLFIFFSAAGADERILSFHSNITVHKDASMTVRETISVTCEGKEIKRGIYRDFPTTYKDLLGNKYRVKFEVLEVLKGGNPEPYHIELRSNGKRVYIGQKDVFLQPGEYTYTLTYKTDRQLGFFKDFDELYWNVTGNDWVFPIDEATASVELPEEVSGKIISMAGYTGPQGSDEKSFHSNVDSSGKITFSATRSLHPHEGLTIAVSWPKGYVTEPDIETKVNYFLSDNRGTIVGLTGVIFLFIFYLLIWSKVGKDPEAGTIFPIYTPPDNMSPSVMRFITKMGFDDKVIASAIISMAVKGSLSIRESDDGYVLHKKTDGKSPLSPEEQKIMTNLLGSSSSITLMTANHQKIRAAIQDLKDFLKLKYEKIYFMTNRKYFIFGLLLSIFFLAFTGYWTAQGEGNLPLFLFMCAWLSIWSIGVIVLLSQVISRWKNAFSGHQKKFVHVGGALFLTLFSLPFIGGEIIGLFVLTTATSVHMIFYLLLTVFVNYLFYHLLKAPTRAGRKLLDAIEGFKTYLAATEKDRLNLLNPPEKTPELFERYLPYALALDVEQEWSEQFTEILAAAATEPDRGYSPLWYTGTSFQSLGATDFASSFGNSLAGAVSSSSTAPGSSSGSGGGGSSGGGGGGGGGGGW